MLLNPANDWNGMKRWERTGPRNERSEAVEQLGRLASDCCLLPHAYMSAALERPLPVNA